jgi:hypothetical protein
VGLRSTFFPGKIQYHILVYNEYLGEAVAINYFELLGGFFALPDS